MTSAYQKQERGDRSAYERYLSGMDASMKQKVALTAAHLLSSGRAADMGMGSGGGTFALASLYPSLHVTGVDINPTMVSLAAEKYGLPNLDFTAGDIAQPVFPAGSLDAIFDSSVLHHVTTFSGYSYEAAARALRTQAAQLAAHGTLIVRDFLDPGAGEVLLDLPDDDGDATDDPHSCSTARLLVRFSREFRKLSDSPGFAIEELAPPSENVRRFRLTRKLAAEFVLRKDYRRDWDTEVLEEYTYFTREQFESVMSAISLRILASAPVWNPWIVRNRFEGKFVMRTLDGTPLEPPPTNYVIAAEKVAPGEGVRFESTGSVSPPGFLSMECYRHRTTGVVMDLVRRPHPTVDVVPWFTAADDVYVLARKSYPRPIAGAVNTPALDGSSPTTWVTEPLNVLQRDEPLGRTVEDALHSLADVSPASIRGMSSGTSYYPSPGGIEEEVRAVLVEIEPEFTQKTMTGLSGFASSGHVRAIEATQLLRAAQVGGLSDARLEINVYELLQRLGRDPGPWIGDSLSLRHDVPRGTVARGTTSRPVARRAFDRVPANESTGFLSLRCETFTELDANGKQLASQPLEYVLPSRTSVNTVAVALLMSLDGEVHVGLDDDDLPAAQSFTGNSNLLVVPAWRLPDSAGSRLDARTWIESRLLDEYGLSCEQWWELGGRYYPSPGLTPERVYPWAAEVRVDAPRRPLQWIPLREAAASAPALPDGHLRVAVLRAAHALGLR